jgi:hypothetical protein
MIPNENIKAVRELLESMIEFTKPLSNFDGYWRLAQGPHTLIPTIQKAIDMLEENNNV